MPSRTECYDPPENASPPIVGLLSLTGFVLDRPRNTSVRQTPFNERLADSAPTVADLPQHIYNRAVVQLKVQIVRYAEDYFPGILECELSSDFVSSAKCHRTPDGSKTYATVRPHGSTLGAAGGVTSN